MDRRCLFTGGMSCVMGPSGAVAIWFPRPTLTDDDLLARFKKRWPCIWHRNVRKGGILTHRKTLLMMAREDFQRGLLC